MIRLLLDNGADVQAQEKNRSTPLHDTAWNGNVDVARLLLEKGADVRAQQTNGQTPLHRAARNGNADMVRLMLQAKNRQGHSPIIHR